MSLIILEHVTSIKTQCIGILFPNILSYTHSMASENQIVTFSACLMADLQVTPAAGDFRSSPLHRRVVRRPINLYYYPRGAVKNMNIKICVWRVSDWQHRPRFRKRKKTVYVRW